MMKFLIIPSLAIIFGGFLLFAPIGVSAAGLVPCGSAGETPCTLCHFIGLAYNIIRFLLSILFVTALVVLLAAGIMYIVSAGNPQLIQTAKTALKYSLIGVFIALIAWVVITWIFKSLTVGGNVPTTTFYSNALTSWNFACDATGSTQQQTENPTPQENCNAAAGCSWHAASQSCQCVEL